MKLVLFILLLFINSYSALYRVAKDKNAYGAQFSTIQEAVDACNSGNDIIIVMDNSVYNEIVTFKNKKGVILTSQSYLDNPKIVHNKNFIPTIKYTDLLHIYPQKPEDFRPQDFGLSTPQKNDFQSNGVVRFLHSENCKIEGFNIDGDDGQRGQLVNSLKAGNREVAEGGVGWITGGDIWYAGAYPIYTGTSGISVNNSRLITVRRCNIYNNFYGINEYGRDPQGIYAREEGKRVPLSKYGASGNNLYELNHIFDNTYSVIVQFSWGLGSTFRHNLVYDNYIRTNSNLFGNAGGAFEISDAFEPQWKVYNNTFYNNTCIIKEGWRTGPNWLFSNNLVARPTKVGEIGKEMIAKYTNIFHNVFDVQQTFIKPSYIKSGNIDGKWVNYIEPCPIMFYSGTIYYGWTLSSGGTVTVRYIGNNGDTLQKDIEINNMLPDAKVIVANSVDISSQENYWATTLLVNNGDSIYYRRMFKSIDRTSNNFLLPNYYDSLHPLFNLIRDRSRLEDGVIDRDFTNGDIGALCELQNGQGIDWTGQFEGSRLKIIDGTFAQIDPNSGDTKINFSINIINGNKNSFSDSTLQYASILYYNNMPDLNNNVKQIPPPIKIDISKLNRPKIGGNTLSLTGLPKPGTNALFQIVVKAKNSIGSDVYSNIGVFPFRNNIVTSSGTYEIAYFDVKFYKNGTEVSKAEVGEELTLKVSLPGFSVEQNKINLITQSGDNLLYNDTIITTWPIPFSEKGDIKVKFNRTGVQILNVSGNNSSTVAIGSSSPIEITPAAPNYAKFYDPPSSKDGTILTAVPAHSTQKCVVKVYDRFGNLSTNTGGAYKVKVTIDNEDNFKLLDPTGEFIVTDDGTVKFDVEAVADYSSGTAKKARVTVKLIGASGEEDYTDLMIGPPLELLYAVPEKDSAYVGDIVAVHLLVSKDGKTALKGETTTFTITNVSNTNFYWDAAGTLPISTDVAYSMTEDTVIYVSRTTPGTSDYSLKEGTGRRTRINKVTFTQPPIVEIFITWSKDSTNIADQPIAIPISDGSFDLYSWGKDEQGNIISVPIEWEGTGVFSSIKGTGSSAHIELDPTMIGVGTFKGSYPSKNLTTETAEITILDKVDEIYLIKAEDYDTGITRAELKALKLTKDSVITVSLGDSISLYSIGVDTTKNVIFKLRLQWDINNVNDFKFRKDSSNADNFTRVFDINEVKAVGEANIKIQYTPADTTTKPILREYCKLNIVDPVDNILLKTPDNVSDDQTNILLSGVNNGDTVSVDVNAITLNRNMLGISTFWRKSDSSLVPLAVEWSVKSIKIADKVYKYPKDTAVTKIDLIMKDFDMIEITVSRNGIDLTFYVKMLDLIKIGIYPNPVPVERFTGQKNEKPTIRLIAPGTVRDIYLMIFDGNGNVVKILSGIGSDGDFVKEGGETSATTAITDSTQSKAETYICKKWDGKNLYGQTVSSGRYIMNFKYKYLDEDLKEQQQVEIVPFYIIGKKE